MSDPKSIVKEYLAKNGYPLEMFVAKQFRLAGFEVYQSSIYIDKETGKHREIDVTAYYVQYLRDIQFSFKIFIECKYATNPWVLFSGENTGFKDFKVDSIYGSNYAGSRLLNKLAQIQEFNDNLPFRINQMLCYGLTESHINQNNKPEDGRNTYKAVMGLLNALQFERENVKHNKTFDLYIPIIVVQGKLFECFLDDNDQEQINEIDEGQLLYKSNVFPGVFPLIEIVTKDKVQNVAQKLYKDLNSICNTFFVEIENLVNNFPLEGSVVL